MSLDKLELIIRTFFPWRSRESLNKNRIVLKVQLWIVEASRASRTVQSDENEPVSSSLSSDLDELTSFKNQNLSLTAEHNSLSTVTPKPADGGDSLLKQQSLVRCAPPLSHAPWPTLNGIHLSSELAPKNFFLFFFFSSAKQTLLLFLLEPPTQMNTKVLN